MAKRIIRLEDDEILRKTSRPVSSVTPNILMLLDDMKDTMYDANGVGLAAVQVGSLRRIVVIDVSQDQTGLIEMINPEIVETDGMQVSNEGCLSIPKYVAHVDRPSKATVKYYDREMTEKTLVAEGYLAVAICHEIDHLDGILFTDKSYELPDDDYSDSK